MMRVLVFVLFFAFHGVLFASHLGRETYEIACQACHAPQVAGAIHAPVAFNKAVWAARFKQAALQSKNNPDRFKTARDYLLYKVSIGKGLMPHGGLCKEAEGSHKHCSDEAIREAIDYMAGMKESH